MKKFSIVVAVFAFFAMTAVAFAANTANISVTSEPIKERAACDKAGGFAITFDDGTNFVSGDQITFDLPLNVYLCRGIDMRVGVGLASRVDASGFNNDLPDLGSTLSPVTCDAAGSVSTVLGGVTFQIVGMVNTSRVTINVQGDSDGDGSQDSNANGGTFPSMLFTGGAPDDALELAFLDQVTYGTDNLGQGIYKKSTTASQAYRGYNIDVLLEDNTLCIDVEEYDQETVNASFDSKNDKYTWIPSNPQVAHVVAGNDLVFYTCEKNACGRLLLPGSGTQGVDGSCPDPIDNEAGVGITSSSYAGTTAGYCANTHRNNKVIIRTNDGAAWDSSDFSVELTILVNGAAGDNGVYFYAGSNIGASGFDTPAAVCAATSSGTVSAVHTRYNAADAILSSMTADSDCDIAAANRAVRMTVAGSTLNLNQTTNDYLWLDLPLMVIDGSLFQAGDIVEVEVVINKAPCGEVFRGIHCIGTAGCESVATSYCLRYPYFGNPAGAYISAVVVDNLSSTAGTVTFTMYEDDGDMFTSAAVPVDGYGMIVQQITSPAMGWTGGPGTAGDAKSFITTSGTVSTDGCALITNAGTGESISYLPRMINCSTGAVM